MKVNDVMTRKPASCSLDTNLAAAVEILWGRNCGILPVLDSDGKLASVVTDRDICIAVGTRNGLPSEITVGDVVSHAALCCRAEDDVHSALATMAEGKVRRLPVIDADGKLAGILSIDDVIYRASVRVVAIAKGSELTSDEVVSTLKQIYAPQRPISLTKAAVA